MKRKNKACYFCGQPGTSLEHVPSKQMFIAFDCDAITVPSCNKHNNGKSGIDEAIVKSFLIAIEGDSKRRSLNQNVQSALKAAAHRFDQVKNTVIRGPFVKNKSDALLSQQTAFVKDNLGIPIWVTQVTAGLIWDCMQDFENGNDWSGADSWSLNYIKQGENGELSEEEHLRIVTENQVRANKLLSHDWIEGWSSFPRKYPSDIYNFKVLFTKERIVFLHEFYADYHWVTGFIASDETRSRIKDKLSASI